MKSKTITVYKEWLKTAKKSDKFIASGVSYTQKEMSELLGETPQPTHVEHADIDIKEKDNGDMEQTSDDGYTQ